MRKFREFKCDNCGFKTDKLVEDDVKTRPCDECAFPMTRMISAVAGSGNSAHGFLKSGRGFN
ncbi:hypothetical protein CPT_Phriendly_064 [Vibrio phage Phriendly]|nr:hypothetical protein CPT_Phriendly_064 [Vibrio phage Phriendly]